MHEHRLSLHYHRTNRTHPHTQLKPLCALPHPLSLHLLNVQETPRFLLDCWLDRPLPGPQRLAKTQRKGTTFHQKRAGIFRSFRWNRSLKPSTTVLHLSADSRSPLFLWIPDGNGEHSLWNLFPAHWHLYKRC